MPASADLVRRVQEATNPKRVLRDAYKTGEYEPTTTAPTERQDPGWARPKKRIYGLNLAQRVRAYNRSGMGGPMKLDRSPTATRSGPDPDMVTKANGGQVLKSEYDAEEEEKKKAMRREQRQAKRREEAKAKQSEAPDKTTANPDTVASSAEGSVLDDMPKPKAKMPRLARPESMINGQKSSAFFADAAKRQKQSNKFAQYVPEEKKPTETVVAKLPKAQLHSSPPKAETPKAETPKAETPKAETPKAETPKVNYPGKWDEHTAKKAVAQSKKDDAEEAEKAKQARAAERDAKNNRPNSRYF